MPTVSVSCQALNGLLKLRENSTYSQIATVLLIWAAGFIYAKHNITEE